MKIVLLGAAGFIGRHMVDILIKQKHQVISIDDLSGGFKDNLNSKSKFIKLDLRNGRKTNQIINIGPQTSYSINQLASEILTQFFDKNSQIPKIIKPKYLPMQPLEIDDATCSDSRVRQLLYYHEEVTLHDGIMKTDTWTKTVGPKPYRYLKELELTSNKLPATWKDKLL